MSKRVRTLAVGGAAVAALLAVPTTATFASAATSPAGAFADAYGVAVDVTAGAGLVGVASTPLGSGPGITSPLSQPLDVLVPPLPTEASQTCPPQQAKPNETNLLNADASPVTSVATVDSIAGANCSPATGVASSQTTHADVLPGSVGPTTALVTADVLRAQANSDCKTAPNGKGSLFTHLIVAGQGVGASPAPNTVIDASPIAMVIVNEQHPAANGRGIVVNAIHIIGESALLRGDIIISHASSGVVCPGGPGSAIGPGLTKPDLTFDKAASPSTAKAGGTVTYTAKVTNTSANACDVLRLVDHLTPGFTITSVAGAFGKTFDTPPPVRSDKGQDVVLHPTTLTLAPKASAVETFTVKLSDSLAPGTYYNSLEIFCNANGDFVSGPLAPVTIPAAAAAAPPPAPADLGKKQLPRTGTNPLLALGAVVLVGTAVGLRKLATR